MKVVVIGHPEAVLGFSLAGLSGLPAVTASEAELALNSAVRDPENGLVLITQDVARLMQARMDELKLRSTLPLIVEIPSPEGIPAGQPSLSEIVLRAIGIKL